MSVRLPDNRSGFFKASYRQGLSLQHESTICPLWRIWFIIRIIYLSQKEKTSIKLKQGSKSNKASQTADFSRIPFHKRQKFYLRFSQTLLSQILPGYPTYLYVCLSLQEKAVRFFVYHVAFLSLSTFQCTCKSPCGRYNKSHVLKRTFLY